MLYASGRARSLAGWLLSDFIFSKPVLRKWRFFSILFSKKNEMHAWHFYYYSVRIVIKASSNVRWKHPFVRSVRSVISGKIRSDRNGSSRSVRSDSSYLRSHRRWFEYLKSQRLKWRSVPVHLYFKILQLLGAYRPDFLCRRSKNLTGTVFWVEMPRIKRL